MKPSESENEFRKRLGQPIEAVTPRRAFETMFAFYEDQRAEDVAIDEGGEMPARSAVGAGRIYEPRERREHRRRPVPVAAVLFDRLDYGDERLERACLV